MLTGIATRWHSARQLMASWRPATAGNTAECVNAFDADYAQPSDDTKQCQGRGETKPVDRFRRHKGRKDGRAGICESCRKAERRDREAAKDRAGQTRWATEYRKAHKLAHADLVACRRTRVTPFTCSNGHKFAATLTDAPKDLQLVWECPCGVFSAKGLPVQLARLRRERLEAQGVTPFQILVPA